MVLIVSRNLYGQRKMGFQVVAQSANLLKVQKKVPILTGRIARNHFTKPKPIYYLSLIVATQPMQSGRVEPGRKNT